MSWARYDDNLPMNKKWLRLRAEGVSGVAALGLHLIANTYARHNGTGGHIEAHIPEMLVGKDARKLVALLVLVGMFDAQADGSWLIHDYAEYHDPADRQPDRSTDERRRELSARRADAGRQGALAKAGKAPSKSLAMPEQTPSPVPVPVPEPYVSSTDTYPPTDCRGGVDNSPRRQAIATAYGRIAVEQGGPTVKSPDAYAAKARQRALADSELVRLAELFPTAPPDVIAAAMHGAKHSLANYPRSDELAPVVHLHA